MQNSPLFQWGTTFTNKIDLSCSKKILDIGCRKGHISTLLAKQYPQQQFIAIDNVACEIEQANTAGLANLNFEVADVLALDYIEHFDTIISFHCLHWILDKRHALHNIYKALKPGGKAYLQFFVLHGRPKNDRFLYQVSQTAPWKHYFKNFQPHYFETTIGEFSGLLQSVGFLINRIENIRYQTHFTHADELTQWLESWASHKDRIPLRKREHFLHEATEAYLSFHHHHQHETVFPYYDYFLEVECEKPSIPSELSAYNPYQYKQANFTVHEARVLKYYLQGLTAKEISRITHTSDKTVEFHLGKIKEKLGCRVRSEIYQAAMNYGFMPLIFNPHL
ncbi:hypothetical protein BH10PSE19_BH10PSE19_14330 [soil metagenome]